MSTPVTLSSDERLRRSRRRRVLLGLALACVALFMMSYFLISFPDLYQLFCRYVGTQQNQNKPTLAVVHKPNGRMVEVLFEGVVADHLPVRFYAEKPDMQVEVGRNVVATYHCKNVSDHPVSFRPIHQLSPLVGAKSFHLLACFCFNNQTIAPGESRDFTVLFYFTPDLDERVNLLTMRYTLFQIDPHEAPSAAQERLRASLNLEANGPVVSPGWVDKPSAPPAVPATGPATAPAPGTTAVSVPASHSTPAPLPTPVPGSAP